MPDKPTLSPDEQEILTERRFVAVRVGAAADLVNATALLIASEIRKGKAKQPLPPGPPEEREGE